MALKIESLVRAFKYNGMELVDPGPAMTPDAVKEFYATVYPEINNAAIEGPEHVGNKAVYEFRRAVGTKGARSLRDKLTAIAAGGVDRPGNMPSDDTLDVSQALRDCAAESHQAYERGHVDALAAPTELIPLLP